MPRDGKKILIVAPDFPFPPNHGGRVDIWGRIRALHRLGFVIDLLATCKKEPSADDTAAVKAYARNISVSLRSRKLFDHLSLFPFQVRSRKALAKMDIGDRYDLILLESEFVYAVLRNPGIAGAPAVMRVHNREPVYFRELAAAAGNRRDQIYFLMESWKFSRLERTIQKHVRHMMFISADEASDYRARYPEINAIFLPAPVDPSNFERQPLESGIVLFIGSLFMVNNREAVGWLVRKVHPLLTDIPKYKLVIAGNSRGTDLNWIKELMTDDSRIEFVESPGDLAPLYHAASVFVNSMHHGAGVKIKNIEAIQYGLPVVTTKVGNQGTGLVDGRDVRVTDHSNDFAAAVRELLLNPEKGQCLVEAAQKKLAEKYNHERILADFLAPILEKGLR